MPIPDPDQPDIGRFADGAHRYALRVFYEDTDAGGVVYHANYLRFFERGRSNMLRVAGIDIGVSMSEGNGGYVVAGAELRYIRPARLSDVLVIVSRVVEVRNAACVVHQQVMRNDEEIATGRISLVFVGADGRARRQPEAWVEALRPLMEGEKTDDNG